MPGQSKPRKPRTKKPVEARVRVVLDDDCVIALDEAIQELEAKERELAARRDRDINAAIDDDRPGDGPASPTDIRAHAEHAIDIAHDAELDALRKAVAAAEQAVDDQTDVYVFRAIGRHRFNELVAEHPPTDADVEEVRKNTADPNARPSWSYDTFAPALIAATAVTPQLSIEDAEQICADWNDAEVLNLFTAALQVNQTMRRGDVGKASGPTGSAVR